MVRTQNRVSVVIPNWNGEQHLAECLDSLRAQEFRDFQIVVADNASTDGSLALLGASYAEVRVVETGSNLGFAGAVNAGIGASDGELVVLLNNDTRADPAWLAELVKAAEAHPEASSFASLMVLHSDVATVNAAGDSFKMSLGTAVNRGIYEPVTSYAEPCWVFGACAGASMYRRSFFDKVGLFDEQYFLMHEDTDLNMRALLLGERCLYVPTAVVAHKLGASIGTLPSRTGLKMQLRNQTLAAAKTLPWLLLLAELPVFVWRDLRETVPLRPSKWHLLPGLLALVPLRCSARWRGLLSGLRSRRELPRRAVSVRDLVRGFSARAL
jgi:GT2 family glycosyltransferase